jgi:DNA helicase-2/ATP-dependent DNA helicase PcrA
MLQEKFVTNDMNFIINMLKLIQNENDKITFYKICEYLEIDYEEILSEYSNKSLFEIAIEELKNKNPELAKAIKRNGMQMGEYFDEIFNMISKTKQGQENEELLDDIRFFNDVYRDFKNAHPLSEDLSEFLNYLALTSRKEGKGVAILTGHASKGLEFEYVFIISLNQGIWPDYRAVNIARRGVKRELEEERRNCFVAITRTKKKLFVSYVEFKMTRSGNLQPVEPSQFLYEMGLLSKENN